MANLRTVGAGLLLAAALSLTGCGGGNGDTAGKTADDTGSTAASSATPEASSESPAGSGGTVVSARESEFAIELSQTEFSPGTYTFRVENQGDLPHDLKIKGPGVEGRATETLQAGQSGELEVNLQEGTYEIWCSIGNHRAQGMATTIQVG